MPARVWTNHSVDSRWVRGEARDAADRGVLFPVRFENARLPIHFRAVHTTDLDDWAENRDSAPFRALRKALEGKLGTRRQTTAIAVLLLANMSADPENEYFSDGMTEEIINALSKVPGLHVASRASSFAFKAKKDVGCPPDRRETRRDDVPGRQRRKVGNRIRSRRSSSTSRAAISSGRRPTTVSSTTSSHVQDEIRGPSSMR